MLSKRRLESYRRAEVVAQAARGFMAARVVERESRWEVLTAAVLDWMTVTGKQKYDTPVRRGRSR